MTVRYIFSLDGFLVFEIYDYFENFLLKICLIKIFPQCAWVKNEKSTTLGRILYVNSFHVYNSFCTCKWTNYQFYYSFTIDKNSPWPPHRKQCSLRKNRTNTRILYNWETTKMVCWHFLDYLDVQIISLFRSLRREMVMSPCPGNKFHYGVSISCW